MKHIEASKLVKLASDIEPAVIKHSFVERLRGAFHIETVGEGNEHFTMTGTGKNVPCTCSFNVVLRTDKTHARIIVDGETEISASTKMLYVLGFLALPVLGLLPGTNIKSGGGSAIDLMVFLFLGVFILYDVSRKLAEPEILIDRILQAVATEFGA